MIVECEQPPYVVNPLSVSKKALDLRIVNQHIWKQSVKYDDLKNALAYLKKGFHLIRFDITSAYHFCEIFPLHTEMLGFAWLDSSGKRRYCFGLRSACYLFSKLTRPLIAKWRGEGKLILMYLDDGFGCAQNFSRALQFGCEIKSDLLKSGFVPKAEK